MLDLMSGFWQMQLDQKSQPLTAFTMPGQGQYQWIMSPMDLLGCPASFQCHMEGVLRNISNVIGDMLVHTKTHEEHLQVLDHILECLHHHNLKINLDKCFFDNIEVSYLGFTLTPEGIKPGKNKLNAIKDAKLLSKPFGHLLHFAIFRTHIKNFVIITAPLFRLTRKDSGYKGGPLPKEAMDSFCILKNLLVSEPVMAFPSVNRQYTLITDAATSPANIAGGLSAILMQKDQFDNFYAISYAFRQLKDHRKKLLSIPRQICCCSMGDGYFQQIPQKKKNHTLP
jgi:hypothetical protein